MMSYEYQAVDQQGKRIKGVLQADNPKALRQALRAKQWVPLVVTEITQAQKQRRWWKRQTVSHPAMTLMTRQLATLIEAEIPLAEALHGVADQTESPYLKQVVQDLKNKVSEGYALSTALRQYDHLFSQVYCASVASGESSGDLGLILNALADYMENQQKIRQKIIQALIYPAFVMIVAFIFTAILLVSVVPQMLEVFADQQQALPTVTRVLLWMSDAVSAFGLPALLLVMFGLIAFQQACKRPTFKIRWHRFCLRMPIVGKMIISIQTARFMRTTALLAQAGVPLLEAMGAGAKVVTSLPMAQAMYAAAKQVREGLSFYLALANTKMFSAMSLQMLASGERAGQLERMMQRAAVQQETEVEAVITRALTLFEPLMILVMGGVVLFIVLAVLLPVFSATQLF